VLASVALTVIIRQSIEVAAERDRATLERDRARQAVNLLKRAFESADPSQTGGAEVTARQVLTAARPEMELTLERQPELYAELAGTIADVELSLGLWREARELADRAAQMSALAKVEPERRAQLLGLAARAAVRTGELAEAEAALDEAARIAPATDDLRAARGLLLAQQGRYDESVALLREAVAGLASAPPGDSLALRARQSLADTLRLAERHAEALAVLDETFAWQRAGLPEGHPDLARTRNRRAGLLHRVGRAPEAVEEARLALAEFDRIYGARSSSSASARNTLGNALRELGDAAGAAAEYEIALEIWRERLGASNQQTLRAQFNLVQIYAREQTLATPERIEALYREAVDLGRTAFGPGHPTMAAFRHGYGGFLLHLGRPAEALRVLAETGAEASIAEAGPLTREVYSKLLLESLDRLGCRVASNTGKGLDRDRVLEELPLIRASRCVADPQARSGP
jgi:serine/threonine-protein kinase